VANPKPAPPDPTALKNETDCAMRSLFVAFAASVNPNINTRMATEMIDALAGVQKTRFHVMHVSSCIGSSVSHPQFYQWMQRQALFRSAVRIIHRVSHVDLLIAYITASNFRLCT
jgi:hypothetical protein